MESRRAQFKGTCASCARAIKRGEVCFIDKRNSTDGWILWHLKCDAEKPTESPRKPLAHRPRVWIDTRRFKLPWGNLEAL